MRRREFIAAVGGTLAWPVMASAQQRMPIIGYLHSGTLETRRPYIAVFLKGLAETGFVEGQNVGIEYRWANDQADQLPLLAADLVRRKVTVIVTPATTGTALAAKAATQDIPIVFLVGGDPVEAGLVASLNRPSGNVTGVTIINSVVVSKRLEVLRQFVPSATSIGYLMNPTSSPAFVAAELRAAQDAARVLGISLLLLKASSEREIDSVFEGLVRQQAGAVLPNGDSFFNVSRRDQLIMLSSRYRIPIIFDRRENAVAGGLASYGTDIMDAIRRVGVYTGRILKGEKATDLPVQQATKLELVVNLKTANALGLTIPETLLATADEVIQ